MGFGTYDRSVHPRVGVLLDGLAAHGAAVTEVSVPLGLSTAERVQLLRQPWRLPVLAGRLLRCWARLGVRGRTTARRQDPDAVVVGYLGHFDVLLARLLFPRRTLVLDHLVFAADTAADRGSRGGLVQAVLRRLDALALAAADVVVVDTDEHAELARSAAPDRTRVVSVDVGATRPWFDAAPAAETPRADGPLRVVFFGLFTPLHGAATIARALALLDGRGVPVEALLVGGGQDHAEAVRLVGRAAGVRWRPWVDPAELPALVAAHDVCLGIAGDTPKALRVVPTKVFQGAAAGCAIVTSDTRAQRAALDGAAVLVPPGDPVALADALHRLADDPGAVRTLRRAARARAVERFTPRSVVTPLLPLLERTPVPAAPLPPLPPRALLRWDVVRRELDRLHPASVLEIGCGQGAMGARVSARPGTGYLAVEPDDASFAVARERITAQGGTVVHGDHTAVPHAPDPSGGHDLLVACEVLEHLPDDAAALAAWVPLVRPGGHVLISVPAWPARFAPMDTRVGHYRRYTPAQLEALLEAAGLEQARTTVYAWPLGYALEAVRNRLDARWLAAHPGADDPASMAERTAGSGRHQQPARRAPGLAVQAASTPFALLQRLAPTRGTGLVTVARRPA